jgi:hypothetical protein
VARITTYATLATGVQTYMKRSDIGVASGNLDYLCSEVEEEVNAQLRVRRMLTSVTPTVSSAGVVTLPSDFRGWKRFAVRDGTSEWDLELKAAEETTNVSELYTATGVPKALITNGTTSQIWPYTDATYTFAGLYFAMVPQLTSSATTNWLITNYPNVYLYGCLAASRGLVSDDTPVGASRFELWAKLFNRAIQRIKTDNSHEIDSRDYATLTSDTSLFTGSRVSNIQADQ